MSVTIIGIIGIVFLLLMIFLLGTPVSFAMAIVGFIGFSCITSYEAGLGMVGSSLWGSYSRYSFTLIPLFILMGQIVFHSGINKRLYIAAHTWIGHIKGGVAMATIAACAAFAAICGSNTATAATMTTVAFPEMCKYKYHNRLSLGAIACGSTLGVVIPPSVVLIIIGLSTEQSISKLFYGGIGAGLFLTIMFIVTVWVICLIKPSWGPSGEKHSLMHKIRSLSGAYEMVTLFLIVIIGLYMGFFTPTEAGAVGAFFAAVIGFLQRSLSVKGFVAAVKETLRASCMVITIIAGSMIFGKFLAVTRIPHDLASWVVELGVDRNIIILAIFLIYIAGGAIMDALGLLLITLPIFFPVAKELGYDPLWFGVIITVITTLGAITPPVGATTYIVGAMAKDNALKDTFNGVFYFIPAYVVAVLIMMAVPEIITFLPSLIK